MNMDSDDEAFDQFIVMCGDNDEKEIGWLDSVMSEDDDDKENGSLIRTNTISDKTKRQKTNKKQFEKIIHFNEVHNENSTSKSALDDLWENLTADLNNIGPPVRTALQWRRVWSIYKYNKKRTEASSESRGTSQRTRVNFRGAVTGNNGASANSVRSGHENQHQQQQQQEQQQQTSCDCHLRKGPPPDEIVINLLSEIVQQQNTIIHNQEATMAKIETANELLTKIVEKSE